MKRPLLLLSCLLALPLWAQDQPNQPDPKKPGRLVRFLAIGDPPPFQQEIVDGVAREKEPPAGSVPPQQVILGLGDDSKQAAELQLGLTSDALKVPSGPGPLILRKPGKGADTKPWLELQRPEEGDFMVLLWRDPVEKSWDATRALVLPEDPVSAPAGSVRFINTSNFGVGLVYGDERIKLEAGKFLRRKVNQRMDTPFETWTEDAKGRKHRFYSATIFQNANERSLVITYFADGYMPRWPLKTIVLREPMPEVPKAPATAQAPAAR